MSTLYAAKVATKALLEGWPWPAGHDPRISWGGPTKLTDYQANGELIYFGQANMTSPDERLRMGRKGYSEEIILRVVLEVWHTGDDEQGCERRCDELYEQIKLLFAANPTLSGSVNRMTGWTANRTLAPTDKQWWCQTTVEQFIAGEHANP